MKDCSDRLFATVPLDLPTLDQLQQVLQSGLSTVYETVSVEAVECPDLRSAPFGLAAAGLGGRPTTVDVGGPANLYPTLRKDKKYDLRSICKTVGFETAAFAMGPGAGPFHKAVVGCNCEMMANYCFDGSNEIVSTKLAKINAETGSYQQLNNDNSEFCLMANLLISEGRPGQVLKIVVKRRTITGDDPHMTSFPVVLQRTLNAHYGEKIVSMGGVFLLKQGKAKFHVMPDFYDREFASWDEINDSWLKYFEVSSPIVCLSVVHSADPGDKLKLRLEHTHCYSEHGDAGHLHYDTTPEQVEIEGYFVPAETLCRIDMV